MVNPDHRMTPDQALKHPWIADNRHNAPIADIARNMEHFKATRSSVCLLQSPASNSNQPAEHHTPIPRPQANLKQLDNEDEDDD